MKILMVCTGNTCRSVMAHYLLQKMAKDRGLDDWEIRSCGLAASLTFSVPQTVREALAKENVPHFIHHPAGITDGMLQWADLVLAMTTEHKKIIAKEFPKTGDKVFTLREYAGFTNDPEIADPMGGPDDAYPEAMARIKEALTAILDKATDAGRKDGQTGSLDQQSGGNPPCTKN